MIEASSIYPRHPRTSRLTRRSYCAGRVMVSLKLDQAMRPHGRTMLLLGMLGSAWPFGPPRNSSGLQMPLFVGASAGPTPASCLSSLLLTYLQQRHASATPPLSAERSLTPVTSLCTVTHGSLHETGTCMVNSVQRIHIAAAGNGLERGCLRTPSMDRFLASFTA